MSDRSFDRPFEGVAHSIESPSKYLNMSPPTPRLLDEAPVYGRQIMLI